MSNESSNKSAIELARAYNKFHIELDSMWVKVDAEGKLVEKPEFLEAFEKRVAAAVGMRRNLAAESDALAKALTGDVNEKSPVKTHDQEAKKRTGLG